MLNPSHPEPSGHIQRLTGNVAALERRLAALERAFQGGTSTAAPVVAALPAAGRAGRMLVLASDGKLYLDNGVVWTAQT